MTQGVICLVLGIIAIATFLLQGKQWPTFISAILLGMFLGSTAFGGAVMGWVTSMLSTLTRTLS